MPVDKQVLMRYQVLNKCFRNRYREYSIDDLVMRAMKPYTRPVSPAYRLEPEDFRNRIAEKIKLMNQKYIE